MAWLAEFVIQGFWEGLVEVAYRKWGWVGGAIVLLGPILLLALIVVLVIYS